MNTQNNTSLIMTGPYQMLSVDALSKYRNIEGQNTCILNRLSFHVNDGEVLAIVGPSGSGKSTILRILMGLEPEDSGSIYEQENELAEHKGCENAAMVFQHDGLFPWLNVYDNIALGLQARNEKPDAIAEKVNRAIKLIDLTGFEKTFPKALSGGMRQRVGFARAFVLEPAILLLDEPFSSLDVLTAQTLSDQFYSWWKNDQLNIRSMVWITHNLEEAVTWANRILVLKGRGEHEVKEVHVRTHRLEDLSKVERAERLSVLRDALGIS